MAQTRRLVIVGVSVVDVVAGRIVPDRAVTIEGDVIAAVTSTASAPSGAQVVDGRGAFLIPGLWDAHAHMEASGAAWLPLYVANGVTAIRDMGSQVDLILRMREDTASGRVLGPRVFAAGPILDDAPGDWPFRKRVKTAEDGRAAVQELWQRGVDLVKVHDNTPQAVFFAIAEEARRVGLRLAGHVPRGLTVEQAIDAGQGDIEHLSNGRIWRTCSGGAEYKAEACRPFFEMLARRGIWQTPTLFASSELASIGTPASMVSAEQMAYATTAIREMWKGNQSLFANPEVIRAMRAGAVVNAGVASDMARAGVGVLTGCDSMIAGFCVHDELALMVRGGMTPQAALQTATINPARYFSIEQKVGSVEAGKRADLVMLDGDPLADIANVRRIRGVIVAGRLLDRAALDQVLADVRAAARP
jgi:imidazolonepropionase-like amidohydrolase